MKLSMNWLADFVDVGDVSIKDFAQGMTLSGTKVEMIAAQADSLRNIVVGKILKVEKHPDADRLNICRVDAGKPLTIVTAATNVFDGAYVPVALDGAVLADGTVIKHGKLRGVVSEGMFCSFQELGLEHEDVPYADLDGILILQNEPKIGVEIAEILGLNDTTVEFEVTNNRPDCLSVRGLAREVAATFGRELKFGGRNSEFGVAAGDLPFAVAVEDSALCSRYCGRVVKNIKVEPSPKWLRDRLRASGLRPINNIVDITNYVMLEYGQPMHAFDYVCVQGGEIVVRTARDGETLETLDGKQHKLLSSMLVIADSQKPIGVAGVMGGANSEITDVTRTIVLESATFNGESVRRTAQALNMRTDASSRFEKGLDANNALSALDRACQLIEQLACGEVVGDCVDVCTADISLRNMTLDCNAINALLGTDYSRDVIVKALRALGFGVEGDTVAIPSWRKDVAITADLAEEVARLHDYNAIPRTLNKSGAVGRLTEKQQNVRKLNNLCRGLGYTETLSFSFYGSNAFDQIGLPENSPKRDAIRLLNPLGEDTALMKTTHLPSLLDVLRRNDNLSLGDCAAFVFDKVYIKDADVLPAEKNYLALGCYGHERDFFTLKGAIDALALAFNLPALTYTAKSDCNTFHPGRCATIACDGVEFGVMGQLHPALKNKNDLTQDCFLAELDMDAFWQAALPEKKFAALPRYPAIVRDLALVCKCGVTHEQLHNSIMASAGELLVDLALFDVYEGSQIPDGMKSLAFSLTLRAPDRTLRDEDADAVIEHVLVGCKELAVRR
ncbi:MAG: phenylalanine--tRNA ligase subunit beta [Oscillospiraceae bacterium]|nr:phenylalanine--tRNA ligase subunit beta [Oscillospiraceae bacterium]